MSPLISLIFVVCASLASCQIQGEAPNTNINLKFANTFEFPKTCELPPLDPVVRPAIAEIRPQPDLLQQLVFRGYTTFAKLITAAKLSSYVKANPALTIFAPTEAAFSTYGATNLNALLAPANFNRLVELVTYHFVNGTVSSAAVGRVTSLVTIEGESVVVSRNLMGGLTIDGNNIQRADVSSLNGFIHAVTGVLIPPSHRTLSLLPLLQANGFTQFLGLIFQAAQNASYSSPNVVTVFAPTNAAWNNLDAITRQRLLDPANIRTVVLHHVVRGRQTSSTFANAKTYTTLANTTLTLNIRNLQWRVQDVLIRRFDVFAFNGLYHEIDTILDPFPRNAIPAATAGLGLNVISQNIAKTGKDVAWLNGTGPYTLFAPRDEAWKSVNITDLTTLGMALGYHVVGGLVEFPASGDFNVTYSSQLMNTATGIAEVLSFSRTGNNSIRINGVANIISAAIRVTNGYIYIIDAFLPADILSPKNIIQTLRREGLTTTLLAWNATGLLDVLNGNDLTVFAPTNEAWETTLPLGLTISQLFEPSRSAILRSIVGYQISGSRLAVAFLRTGDLPLIPTLLSGETINVTLTPTSISLNQANILKADIQATNGVVHALDHVIYPPSILPKSLWDTLVREPSFSEFVRLAGLAGLQGLLSDPKQNFTVFVPTNAAIAASAAINDPNEALQVVRYHVAIGDHASNDLRPPLTSLTTVQGSDIALSLTSDLKIQVNGVNLTVVDITATNGYIHVISQVIYPATLFPNTVMDILYQNGLTTLVDLINLANFTFFLTRPSASITFLAPTNKAFNALPQNLLASFRRAPLLLLQLLQYHTVTGGVYPISAFPLGNVQTAYTETIAVTRPNGILFTATANSSRAGVEIGNLFAQNGIVHVIDAVLIPNSLVPLTVLQVLQSFPNVSTFTNALFATNLSASIFGQVTEQLTFFAPSNAAIAAAQTQYASYFNNPAQFSLILQYHISVGRYTTDKLTNGLRISSISRGEILNITTTTVGGVTNRNVNGVRLAVVDQLANTDFNPGVVHTIETVLIPPFITYKVKKDKN